jgi:hypothetical protein
MCPDGVIRLGEERVVPAGPLLTPEEVSEALRYLLRSFPWETDEVGSEGCDGQVCAGGLAVSHEQKDFLVGEQVLGVSDDDGPVLLRIRVTPSPAAQAPVSGVGIHKQHIRGPGKTALLAYLIPHSQLLHDASGILFTVNDGGLGLFKLIRCLHEDGYSVILEREDKECTEA